MQIKRSTRKVGEIYTLCPDEAGALAAPRSLRRRKSCGRGSSYMPPNDERNESIQKIRHDGFVGCLLRMLFSNKLTRLRRSFSMFRKRSFSGLQQKRNEIINHHLVSWPSNPLLELALDSVLGNSQFLGMIDVSMKLDKIFKDMPLASRNI